MLQENHPLGPLALGQVSAILACGVLRCVLGIAAHAARYQWSAARLDHKSTLNSDHSWTRL